MAFFRFAMRLVFCKFFICLFCVLPILQLHADELSVQELYDVGCQKMHENNWDQALAHFSSISLYFQQTPFYADALFYSAVCTYHKSELGLANKQFDLYLNTGGKLQHFEKVFDYKLAIADQYAQGIKKRLFGVKRLPRWVSAKGDALALYEEITAALPGKEIAALALYNKAGLELVKKNYTDCLADLQLLCRKFPNHSLAAESYLLISKIYLDQSRHESQNPDLAALAQINIQRFSKNFPSDERVEVAKKNLLEMQEIYAQSLYDVGRFYERTKKPNASMIYYADALHKYPETQAALHCQERLAQLKNG